MVFSVKTYNNINQIGLKELGNHFQIDGDLAKNPDAYIIRSQNLHDTVFPENLKAIARAGAGTNNIPVDEATEKGIVVFNTPGANANAVKEAVLASILLSARDYIAANAWVNTLSGDDVPKQIEAGKKQFAGSEIAGKTLGVIGLGAIGVLVANVARHLGMDVYGVDPFLSVKNALSLSRDITVVKSYDELYEICDYITVHVPYIPDTKGMLNKEAFAKMKDGVVILNYARDLLVNDEDMKAALESGKVARYVTDFPNPAVMQMPHVIATPHLGASTAESEDNCAVMAAHEISEFMENGNIINSVNYPNCDAGVCNTKGRITVAHRNIPKMLNRFTEVLSDEGINIDHMTNKSRGDYSYCVFDIDSDSTQEIADKLNAIDGVLKVRVIK